MSVLKLDWETRSDVDITRCGAYRYVESPHADALLASYKIGDGPRRRWQRGEPCPDDIRAHVEAGGEIHAFNAAFERLVWWHIMTPRHGWPKPRLEQFRCTAVTAAAMSLPRSLDRLGDALGLKVTKDKAGKALMRIHSIPIGFDATGAPIWHALADDPDSLERYHCYCDTDVDTEEEASGRLIPLSDSEMRAYWLNETVNDRGLRIDVTSARAALSMIAKAKEKINAELKEITGGVVQRVTESAAMKRWVQSQGVEMASFDKDDVEELLEYAEELPHKVRRVLELRQEGAKPSVEKIAAMLDRVSADGRARGVYLHHGAGQTGRFSSRGVQAHNMPKYRKVFENAKPQLSVLFDTIKTGDPDALEFMYGPELGRPLHLLSDAVRSFIWAAPGHELMDADYSSIEGRMAAWFAGEHWKIEAFEALDRGEGHGIYELAAAGIYGIPVEDVTKQLRPTGKVAELSCLAGDTAVLTDRGMIAIREVSLADKLWDGVEWVTHAGVVAKGVRPVVDVAGIRATPDHLIKTGRTWRPAEKIASSRAFLDLALATGSETLPYEAILWGRTTVSPRSLSSATAERLNTRFTSATSGAARQPDVRLARNARARRPEKDTPATLTLSLTRSIVVGFSDALLRASIVAQTLVTRASPTTAVVGSTCSGAPIAEPFSNISSHWTVGMRQLLSSIALKSRKATSPETCASSRTQKTSKTSASRVQCSDASSTSKRRTSNSEPVFDILNSGPRHRFTVFSNDGPLIVHNCQYQTGVGGIKKFARQNKIKLPTLYPALWAAAQEEQREFADKRFEDRVKAHDPNTTLLGREGWIAAELIKVGWRARHPMIVDAWRLLEEAAAAAVQNPGEIASAIGVDYVVRHGFLWCRLPSGRCLAYGAPRMDEVEAPWADKTVDVKLREKKLSITVRGVDAQSEKWIRFPVYGGSLFNNVVQGSARDILVHGMFKAEAAGYPVVLHTHDELAVEVKQGTGDLKAFEKLICELPPWAAGLPLTAGGWRGKRYRKD